MKNLIVLVAIWRLILNNFLNKLLCKVGYHRFTIQVMLKKGYNGSDMVNYFTKERRCEICWCLISVMEGSS